MSLKSIKCNPCSLLLSLSLGLGAVCMGERSHILAAAWPPVEDSARGNGRDEREAIAESLRKRLEFSNNLKYEVDVELVVANNVDGKPQGIIETSPFRRCRVWRLNGSFRVETDLFRPGETSQVSMWSNAGYNTDEGVARSTVKKAGLVAGRIDTEPDRVIACDRYAYFLDGTYPHEEEHILRDLLRFEDQWIVEPVDSDIVRITSPFQPPWEKTPRGSRVILLDRSRGYLPISGDSRQDDSQGYWRIERFRVPEAVQIKDIWMPMRITEELAASPAPKTFSVLNTTVKSIEQGVVSKSDLLVPFSEGIQVVDAIKAVTYTADANGSPAGPVEPVYGAGNLPVAPEPRVKFTQQVLIVGTVAVCMILMAVATMRKRLRRELK